MLNFDVTRLSASLIHEWQKLIGGQRIAALHGIQNLRDIAHRDQYSHRALMTTHGRPRRPTPRTSAGLLMHAFD